MVGKYTPGPWQVGERLTIWGAAGMVAACCASSINQPSLQELANARLISAAPDMLAALNGLLELFEGIDAGEHDDAPELVAAWLAVAKAEGGS